MKILLVEDDELTATVLAELLTAHHYVVNTVADGQTAWNLAQTYHYDLLLVDVFLPGMDGITLCRQLRDAGYQAPILLLTGSDEAQHRVAGLEAGADDYVAKPFEVPELLARIRALLRRSHPLSPKILEWGKLQCNPETAEVTYDTTPIHLTPKEYGLLELFLRNPRHIFSRGALLENLWSMDAFPGEEAVTTQVKGLRQKLKTAGITTDPIETVYGLGYRLRSAPTPESATQASYTPAEEKVMAVIAAARNEFKAKFDEWTAVFRKAIAQLIAGKLEEPLRQQAEAEAHKLIGTLGSLGLLESSAVARQIEQWLKVKTDLGPFEAQQLTQLVTQLKQTLNTQEEPNRATPREAEVNQPRLPHPARLLVIDDDQILTGQLQVEAVLWGLQVEVALSLADARAQIAIAPPDIILLDLTFSDSPETGLTLLAELAAQTSPIPVLVFTAQNQLDDRVKVARLGGRGFLHKPIGPQQVLKAVAQVLDQLHPMEARILVVDDDEQLLNQLRIQLQPWGFQVRTLADPTQFWDVLEESTPDLLILDVQMPAFNGIDLCQAVRNDPRWGQMPILFLSAYSDSETVKQVFTAGADDYVAKPIIEPELIARILNRLERVKMLRRLTGSNTPKAASLT